MKKAKAIELLKLAVPIKALTQQEYADFVEAVNMGMDALAQPEPQWIPCSERLPEEYGEYLVTKRIIGWNCEEYDVNDITYFDDDGFPKADRVLAWMPLPKPFEGGAE